MAGGGASDRGGTVQYRVQFGKGDEAVEGPDDAAVTIRIAAGDCASDPSVAYMRGKLKAEGDTGVLFEELWSGRAETTLSRLASRS